MRYPLLILTYLLTLPLIYGQLATCRVDSAVTLEQWLPQENLWGLRVERYMQYQWPQQLRQIDTHYQSGSQAPSLAEASFRETFQYDRQGRLTERLRQRYRAEASQWQPDWREQVVYEAKGTQTYQSARWQGQDAKWEPLTLKVYRRDEAGHLIEERHYRQVEAGRTKEPLLRFAYRYQGDTQVEATEWRGEEQTWQPAQRTKREWDEDRRLKQELVYRWRQNTGAWQSVRRSQYRYVDQQIEQTVQVWQQGQWRWQASRLERLDAQGRVLRLIVKQREDSRLNEREWEYRYEGSRWTAQHWCIETEYVRQPNGQREPIRRISREYLAGTQLISVIHRRWEADSQDWVLSYRMERERGADTLMAGKQIWSTFRWDQAEGMWIPQTQTNVYQSCDAAEEIWRPLAYPQPERHMLSIDTQQWPPGNCTVRLLDLSGRQVRFFQGPPPPQALSLNLMGLPSGVYVLMAQTAAHAGSVKLWVE
jgi:hypothetical protein